MQDLISCKRNLKIDSLLNWGSVQVLFFNRFVACLKVSIPTQDALLYFESVEAYAFGV